MQKLDRAYSGRVAIVEIEESIKPFASPNAALTSIRIRRTRFDQPIAESLVIPFHVVMINARSDRPPKMLFTERNDSIETLLEVSGSCLALPCGSPALGKGTAQVAPESIAKTEDGEATS